MAPAYEAVDWAATPLGPVSGWSATLLSTVDLMMHTPFPVSLLWGPELRMVYNEAFIALIGDKHPAALGRPVHEVAPESFHVVGPMLHSVLAGEPAILVRDVPVPLHRRGFLEECHFTFSYSPVRGPGGVIGGVMSIVTETTDEVVARRRFELLGNLAEQLSSLSHVGQLAEVALPVLSAAAGDIVAATLRLPGVDASHGPTTVPAQAWSSREFIINGDDGRSVWLPLTPPGAEPGHLVLSPSPLLAFDEEYHDFLRLVAALVRQSVDRVRARDAEVAADRAHRETGHGFRSRLLPQQRVPGADRTDQGHSHDSPAAPHRPPQVAVRYLPAAPGAAWGGDWYDWFALPDDGLAIGIGSVAGHDERAAAAAAQAPTLLRGAALALAPAMPGPVLAGLDRALRSTSPELASTAILVHVVPDPEGFEVRWSNAGHPPPVLLRPDGTAAPLDGSPDLLLGTEPGAPRAEHSLVLTPGSTLVLSSEGLVERRHSSLTSGLEWLVGTLRGLTDQSAEDIADAVLEKSGQGEEDVVLVVVRA